VTWTPQRLAWSALLMSLSEQPTLGERFDAVRECLKAACPHWQLGTSYAGWVEAQQREQQRLVPLVVSKLRQHMQQLAEHQRIGRWEVYAVDGSDGACPRTLANQDAASDKGKPDGMPLLSMTVMYHVALGVPWSFRVGSSSESERGHLDEMLDELPPQALLVTDAGFIGYDFCRKSIEKKRHFLLRVGGNVHLLESLGYQYEVQGETVYLWPLDQQQSNQPPLKLRLIVIRDEGKQPIYLVTSVLDPEELTDAEAREIYHARWGVEVFYRDTKQTLDHDGVQSRTPDNSYLEMTWALLGAWMLKLMTVRELAQQKIAPRRISVAKARNLVRRAMRNAPPPRPRLSFAEALTACQLDNYHRTRPKASRNYPRKKRHKPPQPPKIKSATPQQRQLAQPLTPLIVASS
jgi:hypothetical protein